MLSPRRGQTIQTGISKRRMDPERIAVTAVENRKLDRVLHPVVVYKIRAIVALRAACTPIGV